MLKKVLLSIVCLGFISIIFLSSTSQSQLEKTDFDTILGKWLAHVGFKGDVLEYQKLYDESGYLDYFRILLQEAPKPEASERNPAKIYLEVTDNEAYEFANIKVIEKDISGIKYMYADWIARLAISQAIKKVSKLLGLQAHTEKVKEGLYKVTIDPAKTTEPSRYRFTQIEAFYEIKDLFLTLDITVKGPKDYLILSYYKSELHGILRALENGNFPGSTSEILASELVRGSTSYLIRDLLKVPEAAREKLLEFGRNPEIEEEGLTPPDGY
ncbi:MAG: hypothetical protein V4596_09660 [Bdellovibrionota bacterium]